MNEQEPYRLIFASTVADQFTKRVMFSQGKICWEIGMSVVKIPNALDASRYCPVKCSRLTRGVAKAAA